MTMTGLSCAVAALVGSGVVGLSHAAAPPADLVVTNAAIWTGTDRATAAALAARGGRIIAVGTDADVRPLIGPETQALDLAGRRVIPGFYDSHAHLLMGGLQLGRVTLKDCPDEAEFGRRLREFDGRLPPGRWLLGGDFDHDRTFGGRLPTAELLDKYVPDRPVFLSRYDGHMAVANTVALTAAKVTAETPDPPGGLIHRKPGTREPTGALGDNAMDLVSGLIPPPSDEEVAEAVLRALEEARRFGVTSVQDMAGGDAAERLKLLGLYRRLAGSGRLTLRVELRWPLEGYREAARLIEAEGAGDEWVRIGGVKGFVDGSLGSSTAKFFEPYEGRGGYDGLYVTPPARLKELVQGADAAGLSVAVHAIGDRANADLLDVFGQVAKENGPRDRRFRIEHVQHLRPADYPRFAALGVFASMQPYHAIDDGRWAEGRIGPVRCASSYAFGSLAAANAPLAFGSDWPVAPLDPLLGLDAAVNRRTLDGRHPDGWFPEQRIPVETTLAAYTAGSARAGFTEDRGTLEPGKLADFVVLSDDVLAPAARDRIAEAKVVLTVVGGRIVYDAREPAPPSRSPGT